MLEKLKTYVGKAWLAITAAAIALAYLIGKKKGKENEKAYQNQKVLADLGLASKSRGTLGNPATRRKLREKYTRK